MAEAIKALAEDVIEPLAKEEIQKLRDWITSKADVSSSESKQTEPEQPKACDKFQLPGTLLRRIQSRGETKKAVLEMISNLPDEDEQTAAFCLYILSAMDDPSIIVMDMASLDAKESLAKQKDLVRKQIIMMLLKVVGLISGSSLVSLLIAYLAGGKV